MAKQTARVDAPPPIEPPAGPPSVVFDPVEQQRALNDLIGVAPPIDAGLPAPNLSQGEIDSVRGVVDLMADAPRTGQWIEVTEDGARWVRARWYSTRMRAEFAPPEVREKSRNKLAWLDISCWSTSEPARYRFRVERPVAWRWPKESSDA